MIMYLRYILTLWTSAYSSMDDTVDFGGLFIAQSGRTSRLLQPLAPVGLG